jgi:hypothetical protein
MIAADLYPELTTQMGLRDRPERVDVLSAGCWQVHWRSGRVTVYDRDPCGHLRLGYEPKPHSSHLTAN